ncbi:hypothetical protein V8F33_005512 [Rhypophila sp. PSN 637]
MEFEPGRTTRGPQFSKDDNDTDLYISAAGEDQLNDDAHNPFKQDFSQPISDPEDAALAALAGRYTPPKSTSDTVTGDKREHASPGPASTPPDLAHSESSSHEEHEPGHEDENRPAKRRRKKYSESSRDLLVQPGDDVEEEDRKMRANLQRIGSTVEEEVDQPKGGEGVSDENSHGEKLSLPAGNPASKDAAPSAPADETNRPSESDATDLVGVEPVPLMDKLGDGPGDTKEESTVIPDDDEGTEKPEEAEEDDDIEPKEGDDYDVDNYAVFEDDQDDAGQELEEDGPDVDERQMINEEELVPAWGGKDEDQGGNGNL